FGLLASNSTSAYLGRFSVRLEGVPRALVLSASATPAVLPASGATVTVAGRVSSATTCRLELLSAQSFPVVYSHNPKACAGGHFSAHVTVGPNPTAARRTVAFALVARNVASSFPGRFYVALSAGKASGAGAAVPAASLEPVTAPSVPVGSATSSNWSGYAAPGGPYSLVKGTFTVPTPAVGAPRDSQVSEWVGLDGTGQDDTALIQAGIDENPDPDSPSGYDIQPWWEILPAAETHISGLGVAAGDTVTVTVWKVGAGAWKLNVTDDTNGKGFTTPSEHYTGPGTSAEWIVEAATACEFGCHTVPLAPYSPPVAFSGLGMTGSPQASLEQIAMVQGFDQVSTPSALTSDGFTVSYTGG
ncbi:MAG: G1 family glutamic endopeptidase, partial [Acidimicrobiales bacterium]